MTFLMTSLIYIWKRLVLINQSDGSAINWSFDLSIPVTIMFSSDKGVGGGGYGVNKNLYFVRQKRVGC